MAFCVSCGTRNDDNSAFCGYCGAAMNSKSTNPQPSASNQNYQPFGNYPKNQQYSSDQNQQYQAYPNQPYRYGGQYRTSWLNFIIVVNWIYVVLMGLGGIVILSFAQNSDTSGFYDERGLLQLIGFFLLGTAAVYAVLTIQLGKLNNTARIILIILNCLSIFGLASTGIGLVIAIMEIYGLGFHSETANLFKKSN